MRQVYLFQIGLNLNRDNEQEAHVKKENLQKKGMEFQQHVDTENTQT